MRARYLCGLPAFLHYSYSIVPGEKNAAYDSAHNTEYYIARGFSVIHILLN